MCFKIPSVHYNNSRCTQELKENICNQGWIIQCACAHEVPPHWRPHHKQANVKTVIELKFVIEAKWLKCIETTTAKKGQKRFFYGKKIV